MKSAKNSSGLGPLIELVHHRWNIPVIAELYRRSGAKYITLVNSLDVSRASLSASLDDLIEQGYVVRNTGHGHPMRPEYLLTRDGSAIGEHCLSLATLVRKRRESDLAFRKWTLPLVAAIGNEVKRFRDVHDLLCEATPRAITIGLKSMLERRWAVRTLIDDYPPAAGYALLPRGRGVLARVSELY
ncbi:MAG: winged helix-turn-helix transcriptional regulator [Woeseiaceae bacterium]|nr:winged helix-turn-helix transcriptional regulator [Woeseiaceae bacterium]